MFRNYLKTTLRNLWKNKLYAGINILGLTIGLAAALMIGLYVQRELSYDRFHVNADRIVRATMEYKHSETVNTVATTGTKTGPELKRKFPVVEEYVRTYIRSSIVQQADKMFTEPRILFADDPFFKVFSFHLLKGNAETVLNEPGKIVLTASTAKKYFGNEYPINKTLTVIGKNMLVSGICEDVPENSQLKFDFVTRFLNLPGVENETWWTANWITYFLLKDKSSIPSFQQQVNNYMELPEVKKDAELDGNNYLHYNMEPLQEVHLHSSLAGFEPNNNIRYIYMFVLIAVLILVIACANYTNLATAQSAGRGNEIGMRKVMGASRKQVFAQFMGESAIISFIAALISVALASGLLPYFNEITGSSFTNHNIFQPYALASLLAFAILVSFCAGVYPSLVLSRTKLTGILKKGFSISTGNNSLRKSLVVAQFAISVFLVIYTVVVLQQMNFMQKKDLGYDKDHIVVLPIGGKMKENFQPIKDGLSSVPGVSSVTASYETPEFVQWGDGIIANDEKGMHEVSVNAMPVDLDFTNTLNMTMLSGRDFRLSDFSLMDTTDNNSRFQYSFIINEALAKKIGWTPEQAIGKKLEKGSPGTVVGVVKDFNFSSLHDPIGPLVLFLQRDFAQVYLLRIKSANMNLTIAQLEKTWKTLVPSRPFEYHFLDEDYNKLYKSEQRSLTLFATASSIAIILACLGLFGLAAFTTVQRTKEIGIRRVLGANVVNIVALITSGFVQLIFIAILIAVPLAWWASNKWLQDFAFRIPVQASTFLITSVVVLVIAIATVAYHSVKAAISNPVKNLRTD